MNTKSELPFSLHLAAITRCLLKSQLVIALVYGQLLFAQNKKCPLGELSNSDGSSSHADYKIVPEEGWNPQLSQLVVQQFRSGQWSFGRYDIGIVSELPLQVRTSKGVIPVESRIEGNQLLIRPQSDPNSESVVLAEVGELQNGDTESDLHHPLVFKVPGLKIAQENSRDHAQYSLLLPDGFLPGESKPAPTKADYKIVPEGGWNPQLAELVVQQFRSGQWSFGRYDVGIVSELPLQVRTSKGVVPVKATIEGNKLLIRPESDPEAEPIVLAEVGKLETGDTESDLHHPLEFKVPGLKIVEENSRDHARYSILLPDDLLSP